MRVRIGARVRRFKPGDIVDLPDEEAALLEAAGAAEVIGDPDEALGYYEDAAEGAEDAEDADGPAPTAYGFGGSPATT